jgi:hypothetical protein
MALSFLSGSGSGSSVKFFDIRCVPRMLLHMLSLIGQGILQMPQANRC